MIAPLVGATEFGLEPHYPLSLARLTVSPSGAAGARIYRITSKRWINPTFHTSIAIIDNHHNFYTDKPKSPYTASHAARS